MTSRRPLVVIGGRIQELPIGDDVAAVVNDPEFVRDTVWAALRNGTNISITQNDGADTITISCSVDAEYIRDVIGAALVQGTGTTLSINDALDQITISVDAEYIRDVIGTALSASNGISLTIDDAGDSMSLQADPEYFRDLMGVTLVQGAGVVITVNDAGNTITISADGSTTIPFIYVPAVFYPGTLKTANVIMLRHAIVSDCVLPANCAGSAGGGEVDAAATAVYKIQRSLAASPDSFTDVGAISYASGTHIPTFSTAGGVDINYAHR
jgi:hypothetical protein